MTVDEVSERFCAAVNARDEESAKFACTRAGWESALQGSCGQTFHRSLARGMQLRRVGAPEQAGKRAIVPGLATDPVGDPLGPFWLLIEEHLSNHRIAGTTSFEAYARRYLSGGLAAITDWAALPASPAALAFGEQMARALHGEPAFLPDSMAAKLVPALGAMLTDFPDSAVAPCGSAQLPGTVRHAVGLRFTAPGHADRERWIALDQRGDALEPVAVLPALFAQTMLDGL